MAQGGRTRDDGRALLYHPEVVRMVRAIMIQFRIEEQDLGDCIAIVQTRVLGTMPTEELPTELLPMKALVRKYAYNVAREKVRERCRSGKVVTGPTDAADDHASQSNSDLDPHECARIRAAYDQVVREEAAGKYTGKILGDMMTGAKPRETAKDTGLPPSQVRKKKSQLRALLKNKLVQAGIGVAVITITFGSWQGVEAYNGSVEETRMAQFNASSAYPEIAKHDEPPRFRDLPGIDKAPAYRERAAAACASQQWESCEGDLDMAKLYDPAGEQLPEVQALRKQLTQFEAKPRRRY